MEWGGGGWDEGGLGGGGGGEERNMGRVRERQKWGGLGAEVAITVFPIEMFSEVTMTDFNP